MPTYNSRHMPRRFSKTAIAEEGIVRIDIGDQLSMIELKLEHPPPAAIRVPV
jgi:hypothetical protein